MKFDCEFSVIERYRNAESWHSGISKTKQRIKLEDWHTWFAWHPVRCDDNLYHWLEYVFRKGDFRGYGDDVYWEYLIRSK